MQVVQLLSENDTLDLGSKLIKVLTKGDVLAITGELGAGKTTLARGIIQSENGEIEVPSPTYTLVQTYDMENFELWHCDMYRLETPEDAYELGLFDAFQDAVCVIEWPEKLGSLLPKKIYKIDLKFNNEGRTAYLEGFKEDI
ncbi:MAG: tRNA (adenosine(37)-N6)-threonylcarbamoyltransferase complex ATPase subunit type 1 TsaE [Hellea sp.]|nr:tRNA (adenosine(37)-N6)-threonylcarbamoyltransferase complex ATPase subunit type 1 TsaE [Hellea sp.]